MSSRESDREDLLREATALVERAELQVTGFAELVIVGFRRDGAASFFFGADPVYQFNAAGELRRAFVGGLLYKAERSKLVALRRERSDGAVVLVRHELSADETIGFLKAIQDHLTRLRAALSTRSYVVVGQIPPEAAVAERISGWLEGLKTSIVVAKSPRVR